MDVKESLKYYENEEYRKEINEKYKNISVNLSWCNNIKDVNMSGSRTYIRFK